MGQWLSIPFILLGIYMIWQGLTRPGRFRNRSSRRRKRIQLLKRRKNERYTDDGTGRQTRRQSVGRRRGGIPAGGGSLYTERRPARRIDRRTVQPPYRVVSFTSQERGASLVDEIARVMREGGEAPEADPQAAAQEVYDRWLARAQEANLLTVEGVGVLAFKNFTPDEAFERRLNPQGRELVKIRAPRRFDWALWLGVAAIVIALVYGGREFLMLSGEPETVVAETVATERTDSLAPVESPDALAEAPQAELPAAGEEFRQPSDTHRRSICPCAGGHGGGTGRGTDVVAFGAQLCGAGRFQHDRKCPTRPAGDRGQGAGIPLPDLPFRGEIHGFALLVG